MLFPVPGVHSGSCAKPKHYELVTSLGYGISPFEVYSSCRRFRVTYGMCLTIGGSCESERMRSNGNVEKSVVILLRHTSLVPVDHVQPHRQLVLLPLLKQQFVKSQPCQSNTHSQYSTHRSRKCKRALRAALVLLGVLRCKVYRRYKMADLNVRYGRINRHVRFRGLRRLLRLRPRLKPRWPKWKFHRPTLM